MTNVNKWADGTPKSTGNAFTARPASLFANDPSEQAKATLARKNSFYGQASGAVGHHRIVGKSSEAAESCAVQSADCASVKKGPAMKRIFRFLVHIVRHRSISSARWVDQYENTK